MAIMRPVANVISPEKASQPQPCCPRLLNQTHNRKAPAPISVAPNKSVSRAAPAKGFTIATPPAAAYNNSLKDQTKNPPKSLPRLAWKRRSEERRVGKVGVGPGRSG